MSRLVSLIAVLLACAALGAAQSRAGNALANVAGEGVAIEDQAGEVKITIPLTQAVPWRVRLADDPPRLVAQFSEVEWGEKPVVKSTSVGEVDTGRFAPNWTQMTLALREPLVVTTAEMATRDDGTAVLQIILTPATGGDFRAMAQAHADEAAEIAVDQPAPTVAIDPGHGGFDPGAEAGGLVESSLTLTVARRLKEELVRTGRFKVILTRDEDVFVPLETRLTIAREAEADIFLSLHADTVEEDAEHASGMTVYTLPATEGDAASQRLAERHAGTDILTGADLSGAGDDVALALLDLARLDTQPRAAALSSAIVSAFRAAELPVNTHPERQADLSVLKSADTPSVLIELGFLSSGEDVERLSSEMWQLEAVRALRNALLLWGDEDQLRNAAARR